jgi:hypothetical protein
MSVNNLMMPPLELAPLSGPPIDRVRIEPTHPVVLGRSSQSDIPLTHPQVSRKHAAISPGRQVWAIRDLNSRHGTWVNGGRLAPETPATLKPGDVLQIGPWSFRIEVEGSALPDRVDEFQATLALVDDDDGTGITQTVTLGRELARQHLDILLEAIEFAASAENIDRVAKHLAVAARKGGPFRRALVLRQGAADRADIVASDGSGIEEPVSRTLLAAAAEGNAVEVRDLMALGQAQSIIDRGVRQGVCMPFRCVSRWSAWGASISRPASVRSKTNSTPPDASSNSSCRRCAARRSPSGTRSAPSRADSSQATLQALFPPANAAPRRSWETSPAKAWPRPSSWPRLRARSRPHSTPALTSCSRSNRSTSTSRASPPSTTS